MKFKEIFAESKPKFKVGDVIQYKAGKGGKFTQDKKYTIASIEDGKYILSNLKDYIRINLQDDFELVHKN